MPLLSQWIKKFDKLQLVEFWGGRGESGRGDAPLVIAVAQWDGGNALSAFPLELTFATLKLVHEPQNCVLQLAIRAFLNEKSHTRKWVWDLCEGRTKKIFLRFFVWS